MVWDKDSAEIANERDREFARLGRLKTIIQDEYCAPFGDMLGGAMLDSWVKKLEQFPVDEIEKGLRWFAETWDRSKKYAARPHLHEVIKHLEKHHRDTERADVATCELCDFGYLQVLYHNDETRVGYSGLIACDCPTGEWVRADKGTNSLVAEELREMHRWQLQQAKDEGKSLNMWIWDKKREKKAETDDEQSE